MLLDFKSNNRPYEARGAARALWSCRDEEVLIEGPAGTGKTRGILEKINYCAMRYPKMRALLVRQTRESMTESVLVTLEDQVLPPDTPVLDGPKRNLRQRYVYPNGSAIVLGGLDKPSKVMSTEYDLIALFEGTEATENGYESLITRLRNGMMPYQQIMVDCNPDAPSHWLNQRAKRGQMTRLLSRHEDNPIYYQSGRWTKQGQSYIKKLEGLSGHRFLRLRKGIWAAAEGVVYEEFDAVRHVVPSFIPPRNWRRYRTIDFGYKNPFVCQWWAESENGALYMYRELYMTKRLVSDHAQVIRKHSRDENYMCTLADHDAEGRATLEQEGIHTRPAVKAVTLGIEAVQKRLRVPAKEEGGIFFMRDALIELDDALKESGLPCSTTQEFDGYAWPKGVDGKPIKEIPVPKDDHGMDAMRYLVAHVDDVLAMNLTVQADRAAVVYA